jgi:hypothetical protein
MIVVPCSQEVTKYILSQSSLESETVEGDSPVGEKNISSSVSPSTVEHVEFHGKLGGPSPKAKYTPMTDSEPVP